MKRLDVELARAAGADAANRQMRADGRANWSADDYELAAETMNELLDDDACEYCGANLHPCKCGGGDE